MALGESHPCVGLTLIDIALAEERAGQLDPAKADLERAVRLLKNYEASRRHYHDAYFHLSRLRTAPATAFNRRLDAVTRLAEDANRAEAAGNPPAARTVWKNAIGGFQAFVGADFSFAEADQLELARRYRSILDGFLAFASRVGLSESEAASMYFGISNFKGSVFTHLNRIRLERYHPGLKPLLDVHETVSRRLATLTARDDAKPEAAIVQPLIAAKSELEAEMARRYDSFPKRCNRRRRRRRDRF